MQSQLTIFESYLIDAEKDICQPLKQLSIKQNNEITCCIRDGIISLEFNDTENIYCPFSIVFTRDKTFSFFSFYIGYGAEIACHELIGNADDYLLSRDIDFFLHSKIRAELYFNRQKKIIKASYFPDILLQKKTGALYTFRTGYVLPWKKYFHQTINYQPLI